jgi:hypothetical protein
MYKEKGRGDKIIKRLVKFLKKSELLIAQITNSNLKYLS